MIPLKEVTCFDRIHFRVPEFWTWQRKGKLWGFWRNDESPDVDTGCLWVAHEVFEVGRDPRGGPPTWARYTRDDEEHGERLRFHRWDRHASEGRRMTLAFFSYVVALDQAERPDILEILAVLDREITTASYTPLPR